MIEHGMLRVQFDTEPRRVILSRGRRGGGSPLCAECNGAVIEVRPWTHLAVPPRAFDPRPSKKEVDRAFTAPDADGVIRTGRYNVIQVIDGTVVTIYSWTHPKKALVWCLASTNGFDVSHLKWDGDETYAEVLLELLAKSPTFLAATGLRLRRGLLCVDDVRLEFQTLERGRCYTIGFRHPNFHPMVADPPGFGISSRSTWRLGSPRRLVFQAFRVKQLTILKILFVWSVVKTLDIVVYEWKTLSSYRGEPLTMQTLPSPASPCPGSWPVASGSSTPHLITVLSFALAGQLCVIQTFQEGHTALPRAISL